ncbi:MAG: hypothetical protein Q4F17_08785 [Eubacteriales bacterium]|nr:hypothetical protein [Eubacteriales bacterium]
MNQLDVILLRKNLDTDCCDAGAWLTYPYTRWITLGHFDEIYIYSLNQEHDFFSGIYTDKAHIATHNNATFYYHPLYLVPDKKRIMEDHNSRWFIAIVRIHLSLSQEQANQFQRLSTSFEEDLSSQDMSYQIYYATEFSDMVLDIRSTKLCDLLDVVLKMRKYVEIGKMYTYFGINSEMLSTSTAIPDESDVIPLFSMRFSGTDLPVVVQQIKKIREKLCQEPEYSVNGLDDVLVLYKNLPAASVVNLYRDWLFNTGSENIRQSESTTRVGIQINIEHDFAISERDNLTPLCPKLLPLRDEIVQRIKHKNSTFDYSWFHAVSEIANSMVRMSKSPVMDEVVYLLAPELEAFLENILFQLDNSCMTSSDLSVYNYFVESCIYLIEQLMRIEGQLSQQPEIRPVIYDIPVFMLEYTVAFLNKVSDLLRMTDSHPNKHHVFLLIPRPCEQISAIELFHATSKLTGLVQLQIPEKALYKPTVILRALCHEISHYVGEKYRNRILRKTYYSRASAAILTEAIFKSKQHDLIRFFELTFLNALDNVGEPTIEEMRTLIMSDVESIFASDDALAAFLKAYLEHSTEIARISFPKRDAIDRGLQRFYGRCDDLDILFREIYADICMLYILDISADDYIESLLQELALNANPLSTCEELFAIRIYVSLMATGKMSAYQRNKYRDLWAKIRALIYNIDEEIREGIDGKYKLPLPISSIYALLQYAQICYNTISTSVKPMHTIEVREMFSCLTREDFEYKTILDRIDECRSKMIQASSRA